MPTTSSFFCRKYCGKQSRWGANGPMSSRLFTETDWMRAGFFLTGIRTESVWIGGTSHTPIFICPSKSKCKYSNIGTSNFFYETQWVFLSYCRLHVCLWTLICCKKPTSCSMRSSPGPSLVSRPVNVCWISSSRSSEHQVALKLLWW